MPQSSSTTTMPQNGTPAVKTQAVTPNGVPPLDKRHPGFDGRLGQRHDALCTRDDGAERAGLGQCADQDRG
jgi:hypothetical protein